jgi:hypothetical protein
MRAPLMLLVFMIILIGIEGARAGNAPINNSRMEELFEQDQRDRKGFPDTELSWTEINQRDEARREEAIAALRRGELRTAQDFYIAAVIYHHGQTADHYHLATSLAWMAASIEPDNKTYLWLTASTWDRLMVSREKPQWYGTQPMIDEAGRIVGRYPIDERAVTDEERARFQVMPLEEIQALGNDDWSARIRP